MSCHNHTSNPGTVCLSNNSNISSCNGHSNSSACWCHITTGCHSHANSCSSHSGYVGPRTITFTNTDVTAGEIIDLENEIEELQYELNVEADRRGTPGAPIDVVHGVVDASELRAIRDLFVNVVGGSSQYPYSDAEIAFEELIKHETVEAMKDQLKSNVASTCACDCNYACTCDCNYACTCNCNYCTCHCNYCTCHCNYACTCDCNYNNGSCTCDCNNVNQCFANTGTCSCDCH